MKVASELVLMSGKMIALPLTWSAFARCENPIGQARHQVEGLSRQRFQRRDVALGRCAEHAGIFS